MKKVVGAVPRKHAKRGIKSERVRTWQAVFAEAGRRCARGTGFGECMRKALFELTGKPVKGKVSLGPMPLTIG